MAGRIVSLGCLDGGDACEGLHGLLELWGAGVGILGLSVGCHVVDWIVGVASLRV